MLIVAAFLFGPACHRPAVGGDTLCGQGRAQSPIALGRPPANGTDRVLLHYRPLRFTARDTGHTIQWDFSDGASLAVDGIDYRLLQVHFHAPAEHSVSGARHPLELHFVHRSADGRLAVLGVFGREGPAHPALEGLVAAMPGPDEESGPAPSPEALLPADRTAIRYDGSLTTPPCSEGVTWIVLTEPVEVAAEQLDRLRARHSGNDRPVQPLNGRQLRTVAVAPG